MKTNNPTGSAAPDEKSKAHIKQRVAKKTAAAKGLRYLSDVMPGLQRLRRGKYFIYRDSRGKKITNAATLARIKNLAIPPAYECVWICPHPQGHLQATGLDARGRKQYRYHAKWRSVRDADKFKRMIQFGSCLPKLRRSLRHDLSLSGLPEEKVLALAVALLQTTLIRVGNNDYFRQNHSFGLTTLRNRHVQFLSKNRANLKFRGKGGKDHFIKLTDSRLTRILRRCQELPGQHLFQCLDESGRHHPIDSGMVNNYLLETMGVAADGIGFTAKDFRTWGATLHAIRLLANIPVADSGKTMLSHTITEVCSQVAQGLGNTPAICRKSYINPWVFTAWSLGIRPRETEPLNSLRSHERYALRLLKLQARHPHISLQDRK